MAKRKELRQAYGFDDVAIAPGTVTINPEITDVSTQIGEVKFDLPILASAMDAVVDPSFAIELGRRGGLAVLNLEGLQCRFDDPDSILAEVAGSDTEGATQILQKAYTQPIRSELVGQRIQEIKDGGGRAAVSVTPPNTKKLAPLVDEAGADFLVVQATVTTAKHISSSKTGLILSDLIDQISMPVLVGNTVSYEATLELMREGIAGLLVGVGPGAACTSREVLGIGVPQVTATIDCAAARDTYFEESGRYVPILTDGGIRHRRRPLQILRFGGRCGHDRLPLRRHARGARPWLPLGHGHTTRRTPTRGPGARRAAHVAGKTALRTDLAHRRHRESGRRAAHVHGQHRRAATQGPARRRHDHRPGHQDRGQNLPNEKRLEPAQRTTLGSNARAFAAQSTRSRSRALSLSSIGTDCFPGPRQRTLAIAWTQERPQ